MPLTILTTLIGSLVMLFAWWVTGKRLKQSGTAASRQVILLRQFFAYMGIFFFLMFLPHVWLSIDRSQFPLWMALGYTIGHIFMYLGLMEVARLTVSMMPKMASKDGWIIAITLVANALVTGVTAATMVFGTRPEYSFEQQVTLFNAAPVVGVSIALFAAITVLPAAIMMIVNGARNPAARVRSFLLGGGLFIMMTGGPIHDVAPNGTVYMIADIVTIISILLVCGGVLYRFEERLSPAKIPQPNSSAAHY